MVTKESYFDGSVISLIGLNVITVILTGLTLGLATPYLICVRESWIARHTVIDGKRLIFVGGAWGLFGNWILWSFLVIVTIGIYALWLPIKVKHWTTKNTHFA